MNFSGSLVHSSRASLRGIRQEFGRIELTDRVARLGQYKECVVLRPEIRMIAPDINGKATRVHAASDIAPLWVLRSTLLDHLVNLRGRVVTATPQRIHPLPELRPGCQSAGVLRRRLPPHRP